MTKMTQFRFYIDISLLIIAFLSVTEASSPSKPKRQIYREQVLPSSGGKIPDGAFATDRLALNRLNKAGIAIPDGVLLEHRHVYSHPHRNQHDPEDEDSLVKIIQKSEDRYVPSVGQYHNERPLTIPSTYIIRKPTETTNIRTPNQQMPLHEFLSAKEFGKPYRPFHGYQNVAFPSPGWAPFRFEEPSIGHPTYSYSQQSYPRIKESVAYYPITVPLELPNKKAHKTGFPQGGSVRYHETEDVHKVLSWPYLLSEYTRLADEINGIGHGSYGHSTQHSLFFTPEVVEPYDAYYGGGGRYARKSKEIAFTDHTSDTISRLKSKDPRRVIKLRCTLGSENTVDGHDTKCRLRY